MSTLQVSAPLDIMTVRRINECACGVVIPKHVLVDIGWKKGDRVMLARTDDGRLVLTPVALVKQEELTVES